ncbi:hypothetical protein KI387_010861, partial [Taxus chinensis]
EKAYREFLHSIEQVRQQDALREEIQNVNAHIVCRIREKETHILDLKKQCSDIKSIDLPAAQEKIDELKKRVEECNGFHESGVENAAGNELENLNARLLAGELELSDFIQKYKEHGIIYYRRTLLHKFRAPNSQRFFMAILRVFKLFSFYNKEHVNPCKLFDAAANLRDSSYTKYPLALISLSYLVILIFVSPTCGIHSPGCAETRSDWLHELVYIDFFSTSINSPSARIHISVSFQRILVDMEAFHRSPGSAILPLESHRLFTVYVEVNKNRDGGRFPTYFFEQVASQSITKVLSPSKLMSRRVGRCVAFGFGLGGSVLYVGHRCSPQ